MLIHDFYSMGALQYLSSTALVRFYMLVWPSRASFLLLKGKSLRCLPPLTPQICSSWLYWLTWKVLWPLSSFYLLSKVYSISTRRCISWFNNSCSPMCRVNWSQKYGLSKSVDPKKLSPHYICPLSSVCLCVWGWWQLHPQLTHI